MTATKCKHRTRVHKHACFFVDRSFERLWWKGLHARKISNYFRPLRIQSFHYRVILWNRRRGFDCIVSETFRVCELQKFIELSLVTDRAAQPRADICAAGRARAVIWINHDMIWQVQIKVAERVELLFRELLG